ncbi:putative glutamine ABC transporter permease protein GlnM [Variibacter gotjawalensis]|uniref:Putative glutamine ABC transporter permease protein GlnM n=1 Tax=Variibacter gotjawalensis TaxID=1333996 RepID=A0A0S3PWV6_9BRAD|nr:amino acid ABC transporter permease [Variibacter gotjawalensis]NIK46249.1 general L-amino acid transport system permease protein [Variibacter gotjawalensis]RZS48164.1 general L-amino acid transport system permease protein [Variibacter gotjawalensis]BAT60421.1 putative glutamine ABC transporter permease protein GlnM [Variibacter gotjawalensis]
MSVTPASEPPKVSPLYDPKIRSIAYQVLLCAFVVGLIGFAIKNAADNLARAKIASGFGFWNNLAGFDISQHLIPYSSVTSTYGDAFWVGLLNTLLVAVLGIILATVLGFGVGIARLSKNYLVSRIANGYVEIIRNLPLLLQLLFWYNAVLKALPQVRDSVAIPGGLLLNNRGLFLPAFTFNYGGQLLLGAIGAAIVGGLAFRFWAKRQQITTGKQYPTFLVFLGLLIGLPFLVLLAGQVSVSVAYPEASRFNIRGGTEILPEFVALLLGLVIYTAAFIGEVVRAGILAVSKGQTEAANALGLRGGPTLRLVVIPQAMRVIIPPLTNQYLNLTKNSSLAVAVGYPDLVQIFTGTVLNQTNQAVEVVVITMAVYLTISLVTSIGMNWYNSRKALVER